MNLRPKINPNIDQIGDSGGGGGTSFADITGSPLDNTALVTYLEDVYVKINDNNDIMSLDSNNRSLFYTDGTLVTLNWYNCYVANGDGQAINWIMQKLFRKWFIDNDFEFTDMSKGFILYDRSNGKKYRGYMDGGAFQQEEVL